MLTVQDKFNRRKQRVRTHIARVAVGRPRLTVYRSNKHIYAQVIDDQSRRTLTAASTLDKGIEVTGGNKAAAELVGKLVAEKAKKIGVTNVVFDRGAYLYHGRVKALAEAARAHGLSF